MARVAKKSNNNNNNNNNNNGGYNFNTLIFIGNILLLVVHSILISSPYSIQSELVQFLSNGKCQDNRGAENFQVQALSNIKKQDKELSLQYFEKAAKFMGEKGEGYQGWLHLLAAYDYDPTNPDVLDNMLRNYQMSDLTYLGLDELHNVLKKYPTNAYAQNLLAQVKEEDPDGWESYQSRKAKAWNPGTSDKLGQPRFTIPFATSFVRFDLTKQVPEYKELNKAFYDATIKGYNICAEMWRKKQPGITDTELNHKFFQWQMEILRRTGDYWEEYTKLKLFRDLMETMRHGAALVLEAYGYDKEVANRKAHHEVIFWSSVHTENSVHEPHMTEDSLIGGVYYSSIPPNSGKLDLFDPRQKIKDGMPVPPFHRTYTVEPKEGTLVLFPGWLVHTVRQSKGLNVKRDGYRISISVNLKGEWQDTTKLALDHVDLKRT